MPKKKPQLSMLIGDADNRDIFLTKREIVHKVRFRPSGHIFRRNKILGGSVFEFVVKMLDNPINSVVPFDSQAVPKTKIEKTLQFVK